MRISPLSLVIVVCWAQADAVTLDSLAEVFPLAIGNHWTYHHVRYDSIVTIPAFVRLEAGTARYDIVGRSIASDSTRWMFEERRDLNGIIRYFSQPPHPDSTYTIHDTSHFEMVELHQGRHFLYRLGVLTNEQSLSVFAYTRDYTDTTGVYRFRSVDSSGSVTFQTQSFLFPDIVLTLSFTRGVGQTNVFALAQILSGISYGRHQLIESSTSSVDLHGLGQVPSRFILQQNYPNPFNPTTTIEYSLAHEMNVSLKLYDILGREVMTLAEAKQNAGAHRITVNAEHLSSGTYFCRMKARPTDGGQAGEFVETRKLLYLR